MIEQLQQVVAWRPLRAPSYPLVESAARLCVESGLDLCAIYRIDEANHAMALVTGQRAPDTLGREPSLDTVLEFAEQHGLTLQRVPIVVDGIERAFTLFGTTVDHQVRPSLVRAAEHLLSCAVAQSILLEHHSEVSKRLQRALLPENLATVEGLSFDAAYNPARHEAEVGGDWYDAFETAGGCVGISVGDVTGHGLDAAVRMSEIRHAIRSAASTCSSPGAVLNTVDALALSQDIGLASAMVGILDPASMILRYASAGHPSPIFVTPLGRAQELPAGGTLLGLGLGAASPERTVTLSPGTACVFYTDGLIENDRDPIAGEEALLKGIQSIAAQGPLSAGTIHERVLTSEPRDDCATLVVSRTTADRALHERYTFSALPQSAALFRDAVRNFAERSGIDGDEEFAIVTAAGEAIANAIEHGEHRPSGTATLEIRYERGTISIVVESLGHWRTTSSAERGRGISIMRSCARQVTISSTSEQTRVSLVFAPS